MSKNRLFGSILVITISSFLYFLAEAICNLSGTFDTLSYIMGGAVMLIYESIFDKVREHFK